MNYTDGVILALFLYFFYSGWKKGFFRSILGPISLILGIMVSYIHFIQNDDLLVAVIISIFAPFVIHLILNFLVKMIQKTDEEDNKPDLSTLSRALGGCFRLFWQGTMTALIFLLIALIPGNFDWLSGTQKSIQESLTYEVMNGWTGNKLPTQTFDFKTLREVMQNPETIEEVRNTPSYKNVMENPRIQEILEDESVLEDIKSQNILSLMKNEKILRLMEDENLLQQMFALQGEILKKVGDSDK